MKHALAGVCLLAALLGGCAHAPGGDALDREVHGLMRASRSQGLALALVEDGEVKTVRPYGVRNAQGDALKADTVMYGASLTKAVFAYLVLQLVDEGRIDLDTPIERYLPRPLPSYREAAQRYGPWADLAGDERWRRITPRMLLTHSAGFANFAFLEPDKRLRIHFEPGTRYAYSGVGIMLLQFVLEEGLGLDVGAEMQRRIFDRFGMRNTSMRWRDDFASHLADGFTATGAVQQHDARSKVRAAGSMDTTVEDFARFAAAAVRGEGLSPQARAEWTRPQRPITTARQFPTLMPELPEDQRLPGVSAGLGVVAFQGPQGPGFYKGGHDDGTANQWVCVEARQRCAVVLSNDVRSEAVFPALVQRLVGDTGVPWRWEYGQP